MQDALNVIAPLMASLTVAMVALKLDGSVKIAWAAVLAPVWVSAAGLGLYHLGMMMQANGM